MRYREWGVGAERDSELLEVKALHGVEAELAWLVSERLASLKANVEFEVNGTRSFVFTTINGPSSYIVLGLCRLKLEQGDRFVITAVGADKELAVAEVKHLMRHPNPIPHGEPCEYACNGPRGSWTIIPHRSESVAHGRGVAGMFAAWRREQARVNIALSDTPNYLNCREQARIDSLEVIPDGVENRSYDLRYDAASDAWIKTYDDELVQG